MRIYKTLTEHMNGRIKDESYPSGYKRRAGHDRISDPSGRRSKDRIVTLYEEAPAPATCLYGESDPDSDMWFRRGGTVHLVIEDCPAIAPFMADEVEYVVRRFVREYQSALMVLNGGTILGRDRTATDCYRDACDAHRRVQELVGVDLDETNVAFPYRLYKPNHTVTLKSDPTITTDPTVESLI